jgi:hypothetical protein
MCANVLFSTTSIVAGLFDSDGAKVTSIVGAKVTSIVDEIVASLAASMSIASIIAVVGKIEG